MSCESVFTYFHVSLVCFFLSKIKTIYVNYHMFVHVCLLKGLYLSVCGNVSRGGVSRVFDRGVV